MDTNKQSAETGERDESGRFIPGHAPRGGRPRGSANRSTTALRTAILAALDRAGGPEYLEQLARGQPETFVKLLLRLLPAVPADDNEHAVRLIDPDPDV